MARARGPRMILAAGRFSTIRIPGRPQSADRATGRATLGLHGA